jgi:hypothetical protein
MATMLVVVPFAAWRASSPGGWRFDRALSLWRSLKWVLFSFAAAIALTSMASVSMDIGTMRLLPIYDVEYPQLESARDVMVLGFWLSIAAGLAMFAIDSKMKDTGSRGSVATASG